MKNHRALKTLSVDNRQEWRRWLETHFDFEQEIWLLYPKKSSGRPRILYNDAVEEALCSQPNRERLQWLLSHNMVHPTLIEQIKKIASEPFVFPTDIIAALKEDSLGWEHWQHFSPAYHRIRVAYVDTARTRPEEFRKRLQHLIQKNRVNRHIGYGGIEKYY